MYLLDTHVLLNAVLAPNKLSASHRNLLLNEPNVFYFSNISIWEISLKYSIGKLHLTQHDPEIFLELCLRSGFKLAEIETKHMATFFQLPLHFQHKDPFDRLLIWQCIQLGKILLSEDQKFEYYTHLGLRLSA